MNKKNGKTIKSFDDYKALYAHISHIENLKLLPGHPEFGESSWSFVVLSPMKVIELANTLKKEYDPEILSRALKERSGIIEICTGDIKNPWLIIDSPGVDVEGFRKEFCEDYCDAHELEIEEVE
ncbi:MAG: hypothetical protein JST75_19835 [Bacteroidetes bacterium]|nr:hypothetical protein [Bacteroidota bacterium]